MRGRSVGALLCLAAIAGACAGGGEAPSREAAPIRLSARAVAYSPRDYDPWRESSVTMARVEDDLRALRAVGFRSLVTYGSGGVLGLVPSIARRVGFDDLVVMGIWDPTSTEEIENALAAAAHVDAYCIGNEGLDVRYVGAQLRTAMEHVRSATGRPVTTSERIGDYLTGPKRDWLLANSDWLFPTAHPYWYGRREVTEAAQWIATHYDVLAAQSRRPVILKEASFPTITGIPDSEERQVELFTDLERAGVSFVYFEAYDQEWKRRHPDYTVEDAHWGLFHADGSPKKVVTWIAAHPLG